MSERMQVRGARLRAIAVAIANGQRPTAESEHRFLDTEPRSDFCRPVPKRAIRSRMTHSFCGLRRCFSVGLTNQRHD
jgi:hypothetical protein